MKRQSANQIIALSLMSIFLLTGCVRRYAYYDISLKEVERPVRAKERFGQSRISKIGEGEITRYQFEDEMVKISWLVNPLRISFTLTNKTTHTIKIPWDEAAYVDEHGASHRVMHSGVQYTDRDNPQPPSVIVKGATLNEVVIPTDKVSFYSVSVGWKEQELFPPVPGATLEELNKNAKARIGQKIQILLPLQIEDVLNEYLFTFQIEDVAVR